MAIISSLPSFFQRLLRPTKRLRFWVLLAFLLHYAHRQKIPRWFAGLYKTIGPAIVDLVRAKSSSVAGPQSKSPLLPGVEVEEVKFPDGEVSQIWWGPGCRPVQGDLRARNIWVIIPGGMTHGDCFYIRDAIRSGALGQQLWCIFHNPGVVTRVQGKRPPAGLTETAWLEYFLKEVLYNQYGLSPSLMGFSAGSMLTITACSRVTLQVLPIHPVNTTLSEC